MGVFLSRLQSCYQSCVNLWERAPRSIKMFTPSILMQNIEDVASANNRRHSCMGSDPFAFPGWEELEKLDYKNMINICSYLGVTMQSEVCLWTLLGLLRTIFDATLFKVNANLKQVWHMDMPEELSMPVQRVLRTMISGVMLVQCFTVYVYLASYIVLLYPVFLVVLAADAENPLDRQTHKCVSPLTAENYRASFDNMLSEERPTLVLPWLLLAAVRKLLCELLSLALGLGTCLLLGPARPPCIKFVLIKIVSIMPAFYMWMLIFSYYHVLKVASVFKTFPVALPANDLDYGLELAIRRRRTKSLFGEALVRSRLTSRLYAEKEMAAIKASIVFNEYPTVSPEVPQAETNSGDKRNSETEGNNENVNNEKEVCLIDTDTDFSEAFQYFSAPNRLPSDIGTYEDWFGNEIITPRNTDRINEQLGLMLLRIGAYLRKDGNERKKMLESQSVVDTLSKADANNHVCSTLTGEATDTPPLVGSSKGNVASYLRDYPQIFMKKTSDLQLQQKLDTIRAVRSQIEAVGNEKSNIDGQKNRTNDLKPPNEINETRKKSACKTKHVETQNDMNINDKNTDVSSKDSLSSIITKMKTRSSEEKLSKKRGIKISTSNQELGSSRSSNDENDTSKNRKNSDTGRKSN